MKTTAFSVATFNSDQSLDARLASDLQIVYGLILAHYISGDRQAANRMAGDVVIKMICSDVKSLVQQGANVNLVTQGNFTLAHVATFLNDTSLLRLVAEKGANLDAVDNQGQSLLHIASTGENTLTLLTILDLIRADKARFAERINRQNLKGETALHYALTSKQAARTAQILIAEGAGYDLLDERGESPRMIAQRVNPQILRMIQVYEEDVRCAEAEGFFNVIDYFFSVKLCYQNLPPETLREVSYFENKSYESLLEISREDPEIAEKVMEGTLQMIYVNIAKANDHRVTREVVGKFLQHCSRLVETLVPLVDCGANVNFRARQDYTPLHFAVYFKLQNVVNELVKRGADSSLCDDSGRSPGYYGFSETIAGRALITIPVAKKTVAKAAKAAPAEVVIPKKTAAEKTQELQDLMLSLQRCAATPVRLSGKENAVKKMSWLIEDVATDVNISTANNWTALHLAARFGDVATVQNLIEKGANVSAKTSENFSVLRCAVNNENREVLRQVLKSDQLGFEEILNEVKGAIASKNKDLVSRILSEEKVISKFTALSTKERREIEQELRSSANKISKHVNFQKIKESISSLLEAAVEKKVEAVVVVEKVSKAEKERARKAAKKAREEAEKILAEKQKAVSEIKLTVADISALGILDAINQVGKIVEESQRSASAAFELPDVVLDSQDRGSLELSVSKLSASAPEFSPKLARLEREKMEMRNFLEGSRQINSVRDLPPFLQPSLSELLRLEHHVLLKGSVVYQSPNLVRLPSDLDVEISVKGMSGWSDSRIKSFVAEHFRIEIEDSNIYRGRNADNSVFTVNVKDQDRGLDISFYDPQKQPPDHLSWLHSREEKIFFAANGSARRVKNKSIPQRLRTTNSSSDSREDFLINPDARGLITRLCFLQTIGYITFDEVIGALPAIAPKNPAELLFLELKVDASKTPEGQQEDIREKISAFARGHDFDENLQFAFVSNLSKISKLYSSQSVNPQEVPRYQPLFKVLEDLERFYSSKPSAVLNVGSGANLSAAQVGKTMGSC